MATRALDLVVRVADAVARNDEIRAFGDAVIEPLASGFDAQVVHLCTIDERTGTLQLVAERGVPAAMLSRLDRIDSDGTFLAARAVSSGTAQVIADVDTIDPTLQSARELLLRTHCRSMVSVPLIAGDATIGAFTFARHIARKPSADELDALRAIGAVLAAAVTRSYAVQREHRLREYLERIREASLVIGSTLAPGAVLQLVAEAARNVVGARYGAIGMSAAGSNEPFSPWTSSGMSDEQVRAIGHAPRPIGLLGAAMHEGHGLRVGSIRDDPRFVGFPPGHPPMRGFLGVPLPLHGESPGTLYVADKIQGGEFNADDQRAIEVLGQHAALALAHARTHEQLREREELLRLTIDDAPVGLALVDLDGYFVRVNRALCKITGYASEELTQMRFHDLTHGEDLSADLALSEQLRRGEIERYELPKRYVRKDGSLVPVVLHSAMMRDASGAPRYFVRQIVDVTAAEHAERDRERLLAKLDAERLWLRTVIHHSPIGIVLIEGAAAERLVANQRAEQLFGAPPGTVYSMPRIASAMLRANGTPVPPDELPAFRAMRGESVVRDELLLRPETPGAEPVPVWMDAEPIRDPSGSIVGAVLLAEDIRATKELERMREEWISVIAHDLRQPVTVITAQAGLTARNATNASLVRACTAHVLSSARRLNRMISDLQDLSRLEAHRLELRPQPMDLSPLVRAVVERARADAQEHEIRVEIPASLPLVMVDAQRLEQIMVNLLSNATKYGTPGTELVVSVEPRVDCVQIAVTNRGPGLTPHEIDRLFERFGRTPAARRSGIVGLGLGLYISKGLVEAQGGHISATSTPGESTTFAFTVPIASVAESPT